MSQPPKSSPQGHASDPVWRGTLAILESLSDAFVKRGRQSGTSIQSGAEARNRKPARAGLSACETVAFTGIERLSPNVIAISWHDPTRGCYNGQHWRRRVSRVRGTCALSGAPIVRGSVVYAPTSGACHMPCNAGTMILESALVNAGHAADERLFEVAAAELER